MLSTLTRTSLKIDGDINGRGTKFISPVCLYNSTDGLVVDVTFRTQWKNMMQDEADRDVSTEDFIAVSLLGGLARHRHHIANCLFDCNLISDNLSNSDAEPFMTYFKSALLKNSFPLRRSVIVFDYPGNYERWGYHARAYHEFDTEHSVKFSYELSTIVILCYSRSHQSWVDPLGSVWESYIAHLTPANRNDKSRPILIVVELISSQGAPFNTGNITVEFNNKYRSTVEQLSEYFNEIHSWRLLNDSYTDAEQFSDWFRNKLERVFSSINQCLDIRHRLFIPGQWLHELDRLIEQRPSDLCAAISNQLNKQAYYHFMYLYKRKSPHSINWFCFCRWLTANFLAYALAAQYVRELMKVIPNSVVDSASTHLYTLFSALHDLEPCGALYKGLGHAKDYFPVYCHQPRKNHVTHLTSQPVYGRSKFKEALGFTSTASWDGNFESACVEQPETDEKKRVTLLIQDYALQRSQKRCDETAVYRSILSLFYQSSIDFDDTSDDTFAIKLIFYCLCCLNRTTVNVHGVCRKCWSSLVTYSKYANILDPPELSAYPMHGTCKMCMIKQCDHCLLPCGHLAYCQRCAGKMVCVYRRCPICKLPAHDKMKVIEL